MPTDVPFNPAVKDGRGTPGLAVPKSNWANPLDTPPYEAYAVTCGVTFTFGGLKITERAEVEDTAGRPDPGPLRRGRAGGRALLPQLPGRHRPDLGRGVRAHRRPLRRHGRPLARGLPPRRRLRRLPNRPVGPQPHRDLLGPENLSQLHGFGGPSRSSIAAVAFPEKLLQEHEEIVFDLKPHWWFMVPASAALGGAIVLGLLSMFGDNAAAKSLAGILILVALVFFGYKYARWTTTNFTLTTERIIYRQGLVSRRGTQMPLEKINTVDFHQRLFERIIGAGDLIIESGSDRGVETFHDVRRPLEVQQEINNQMDLHDQRRYVAPGPAAAAPPLAPGHSIPEQIEKLGELRDRGLLTPAEFEAKKAQLLDRL